VVDVNQWTIDRLDHLRAVPANSSVIRAAETGAVYKVAGGAPLWLNSCAAGCDGVVDVNQWTIDRLDHLRAVPANSTYLRSVEDARMYRTAGGAPLDVSTCAPLGGCPDAVEINQHTIDIRDHLHALPADGTVIQGQPSASFWEFSSGCRQPVSGPQADAVGINDETIDDLAICQQPAIVIADHVLIEGNSATTNATFTVTLSTASKQAVTVDYMTADGSATGTSDYAATTGTLTFAPGETTKTVMVPVRGDRLYEPREQFFVNLFAPANGTISDGRGSGIIRNDDPKPALRITDVRKAEGNQGNTLFVFTVSLSAASGRTTSATVATADGTAEQPGDYTAKSSALTLQPGQTRKTVTVFVTADLLVEPNETFVLSLSNPINAAIADGQGIGTILNDD
jgi:hypothetical protein